MAVLYDLTMISDSGWLLSGPPCIRVLLQECALTKVYS